MRTPGRTLRYRSTQTRKPRRHVCLLFSPLPIQWTRILVDLFVDNLRKVACLGNASEERLARLPPVCPTRRGRRWRRQICIVTRIHRLSIYWAMQTSVSARPSELYDFRDYLALSLACCSARYDGFNPVLMVLKPTLLFSA